MEKIIKEYLEKQIVNDPALRAKYEPSRLGKMVDYITARARKYLSGQSGAIEDSVVFKWARDFFLEGDKIPEDEKKPLQKVTKATTETKTEPKIETRHEEQLSLFDMAGFVDA